MSRAKHRAGIPVESIKSNTKKSPAKSTANTNDWHTSAAYFNNTKQRQSDTKKAEVKARLESLNFRQAAGKNGICFFSQANLIFNDFFPPCLTKA
jgi:hypothetical protein